MRGDIVAVDIGGSHISSLLVNEGANGYERCSPLFTNKVDGGASRERILSEWREHLNNTIARSANFSGRIAVAMPGPFDYERGVGLFSSGGKFSRLQGTSLREAFVGAAAGAMRDGRSKDRTVNFANDAACFGLGASKKIDPDRQQSAIAITLGTGVGSAFIRHGSLVTSGPGIPPGGEVYAQPFHDASADDYFSTRWFVRSAEEEYGLVVAGVKELLETADPKALAAIFSTFNHNLHQLLQPLFTAFQPDNLLIGGNIARAWPYFAPELEAWLAPRSIRLHQALDGESSACLGAAMACFPLPDKTGQR
ncbi:ROK family protein [Neolewinella agarilytica]|uniref:Glucokinase n=1 Tax=Neolewinella agarilytica TaxID=478744 RepID=A0A1H9JK28_9BACT|nr:ROK family protein [Neolewinella agarilytica]SEQ87157.1 glucokinase [Neolewinella agarilytica]